MNTATLVGSCQKGATLRFTITVNLTGPESLESLKKLCDSMGLEYHIREVTCACCKERTSAGFDQVLAKRDCFNEEVIDKARKRGVRGL